MVREIVRRLGGQVAQRRSGAAARQGIYERARTALQEKLRTLDPPLSEAELANAQFALEAAIRRVEQDVAIETAVRRMEQDLLATDIEIVREEDVSHAAQSFISKVKQFIRDRLRLRTHAQ